MQQNVFMVNSITHTHTHTHTPIHPPHHISQNLTQCPVLHAGESITARMVPEKRQQLHLCTSIVANSYIGLFLTTYLCSQCRETKQFN